MASKSHVTELSVRYAETDAMGFVYYGNYLTYFECARISALAELGHPYHIMEQNNIFIPVLSAHVDYKRPAHFGDTLQIHMQRCRLGHTRIKFNYSVFRNKDLLATGYSTHAFMDSNGKPIRPPKEIFELFPEEPS